METPLIVAPAPAPTPRASPRTWSPLPPPFDPAAALGDLAEPLRGPPPRAGAPAIVATLRGDLAPEAGPEVAAEYAVLRGPFERLDVVGCARIGRHRMVKLRLQGPRGHVVLQERWMPSERGWRVAAVEAGRAPSPRR